MLVDIMDGRKYRKSAARTLLAVVPSVVWLKVLERSSVGSAELLDPVDVFVPIRPFSVDGELTGLLDLFRDPSLETSNVELKYEMIQSGAEVEKNLSNCKRPFGLNVGQLTEIEAILKSAPISFGTNGPSFAGRPDVLNVILEVCELSISTRQLGEWPFDASGHDSKPISGGR